MTIKQALLINFCKISPQRNLKIIAYEADPKGLNFNKVYMGTHRRSGLLISKIALEKLFRYLINCAGVTRQNRFLRNHDF